MEPRKNPAALRMIAMGEILHELANYGEKELYLPEPEKIEIIKEVLDTFDIEYEVIQDGSDVKITMKDSLWGR